MGIQPWFPAMKTAMTSPIHRRIEGCLLDWVVPQADVDRWESRKRAYAEAGRADRGPRGPWTGMKAVSQAPWDPSATLLWEIDAYDHSRAMTGLFLSTESDDGRPSPRRNLGFFASPAEARLFAASLALATEKPPLDDLLEENGFKPFRGKDGQEDDAVRWERRLKSGILELSIEPEMTINTSRYGESRMNRALHLVYEGRSAGRSLPIVLSCAWWGSNVPSDAPDSTPHPAFGIGEDTFIFDVATALTLADARLEMGDIRKPLTDDQEIAFIQEMIARRDAAPEELTRTFDMR
jgi:hypothetical protein